MAYEFKIPRQRVVLLDIGTTPRVGPYDPVVDSDGTKWIFARCEFGDHLPAGKERVTYMEVFEVSHGV